MEPKVVFEGEELLVLDKPAGMVVNNSETAKNETVESWLANNFQFSIFPPKADPPLADNFQLMRHGIVHRLDKETSGLLIVAKTPEAFEDLQRQFKERLVKKTYIALVHGSVKPEEGEIKVPVGRLPWNRKRFGVVAGGREAVTKYKILRYLDIEILGKMTLVELFPQTGRTHQLRVHLKSIGHPIVSDEFYAGRKTARNDRKWCPRLFLHASKITFTHPKTGEKLTLESPLPEELNTALRSATKI